MKKAVFDRIRALVGAPQPGEKPDFREPLYRKLVKLCALGDTGAMLALGFWHRRFVTDSMEALLAAYEAGDGSVYGQLYQAVRSYGQDTFSCQAYITWLRRAALYGNAHALALTERCPGYRGLEILKEATQKPGLFGCQLYYSYELERLGLMGVKAGMDEFGLYPLDPDGIHRGYYLADYIPADSDGFGREDAYEDIFYDEFFNLLGKDYQKAKDLAAKLALQREQYWADHPQDAPHRKYRPLQTG